jgi:hypothetical protein
MTSVEREHSVCELAADKWIGAGLRKRLREEGFARLTLVISRDCSRINERLARVFQLDYGAYMAVNGLLAVAVSGCLLISCGGSEAPRAPAAERKRAAPKKVLPAGPAPSTSRTVEKCDAACSGCTVLLAADATKRTPSRPLRDYERTTLDIYFRSHLLSHECTSDPQHLEVAAIGSVDDVSTVKEIVVGAFTAAGPELRRKPRELAFAGRPGVAIDAPLSVREAGFSLHAATRAGPADEQGRQAPLKYIRRPPLANERLLPGPDGLVRIALKKPFSDGTVAVDLDPLSLLCRLVALVPAPRFHTVRYFGVLAAAAKWRPLVVPKPQPKQTFISFFSGHCGLLGSHAEHYGTTVGLLFEQERLIASGTDGPTLAVELLTRRGSRRSGLTATATACCTSACTAQCSSFRRRAEAEPCS